jgi:hypothetical protein
MYPRQALFNLQVGDTKRGRSKEKPPEISAIIVCGWPKRRHEETEFVPLWKLQLLYVQTRLLTGSCFRFTVSSFLPNLQKGPRLTDLVVVIGLSAFHLPPFIGAFYLGFI